MSAGCGSATTSGTCDVTAIGRCVDCGKAFCASHQGRDAQTAFVDLCAPCLAARRSAQASREMHASVTGGMAYFTAGHALAALRASRIPKAPIYEERLVKETSRFGRSTRLVEQWVLLGDGWVLGEIVWNYNDGGNRGGSDLVGPVLTFYPEHPIRPSYSGCLSDGFARIRPIPGSTGFAVIRTSGYLASQWENLAGAVHRLVAAA